MNRTNFSGSRSRAKGGRLRAFCRIWDMLMFLISAAVVAGACLIVFSTPDADIMRLVAAFDLFACILFLADVFGRWIAGGAKLSFWRSGWADLASSIPYAYYLRFGRLYSMCGSAKRLGLGKFLSDAFVRSGFGSLLAFSTIAFLLSIWICGMAILHFERSAAHALIKTPFDAIWFAFGTVTTVGYGDVYPVTWQGRVAAIVLMVVGIGLFSLNSGLWASWLVRRLHLETLESGGRPGGGGGFGEIGEGVENFAESENPNGADDFARAAECGGESAGSETQARTDSAEGVSDAIGTDTGTDTDTDADRGTGTDTGAGRSTDAGTGARRSDSGGA